MARTEERARAAAPEPQGWRQRLTGGAPMLPLAVLFGLNFVDEFDRLAFDTLVPEIQESFGLSDAGIAAIGIISGALLLLAALPVGVVGDRISRIKIAAVSALLWGTMTIATGLAPTVIILFFARLFAGIGRISNEVIHPSLLSDYYRADYHPSVFRLHRLANPFAGVAGIIAGTLASDAVFGDWRPAFFVLAVPTFLLIVALVKLREPKRGESIDAELAEEAEITDEKIPFSEARRQLFSVRTLRRLWLGAFFLGVGWVPVGTLLSLFFENVYDYGPQGRGFVTFLRNAGIVAGLFIGAVLAERVQARGKRQHLATITGLGFAGFAIGLILMAAVPSAVGSTILTFVLSIGIGVYQPAYFSLVGQVAPPKVRSQAYAWAVLFVGAGSLLAIPLFSLGDEQGYRLAVFVFAGFVGFASLIGITAARFVRRDIDQAEKTLETAVALRRQLSESGEKSLLVCRGVEVAYDQVQVLFGVDMEVQEGEIVALLGTNGAGKSTLLKAISGLVDPVGGAIFFAGRDITHADPVQATKAGIIMVPGGKAVFPTLSVAEHFKAAQWLYAKDEAEVARATEEVLDMFPRLRERWGQMAGNMSGGEQQMLALGMAFIANPRLLIIDELSLGLAPTIVEQLLGIVRRIHADGATVILVEQSINIALTIASRAYFMEKGEVRFSGPTEELLERKDILRSVFLEGAASMEDDPKSKAKQKQEARAEAARVEELAETREIDPDAYTGPVLEVHGLTKRFGGITAVDDVDIVLEENQILGLIGPNGAGKTTIFDLISGHLQHDVGRIALVGQDVSDWSADRRAALGLGRSFQDARIFPTMTVAENIALALERHIEVRDHVAAFLDLPAVKDSEENIAWTVGDLVELMGLGAFRDKFVSELSTGSRRIVDLAMSIAHDPTVLLLDEPSSGIAQKETEALGPLLKRIQRETSCALLVIEHDMPLITSVSDEIVALELGRVVLQDIPERVLKDPRVVEAYLGGDLDVIQRSGAGTAEGGKKKAPKRRRRKTTTKKKKPGEGSR